MDILFHGVGFYSLDRPLGPSVWPHADMIAVLEGEFLLHVSGEPFSFVQGDVLAIPAHLQFGGRCTAEKGSIWVLHHRGFRAREGSPFHAANRTPVMIPNAFRSRLERLLLEDFATRWRGEESTELRLMAELLLARAERAFFEPKRPEPTRLKAAVEAGLREGFSCSVGQLAQLAGLCPSRFRQLFGEHYGMSPARYLQQVRMEEAKRLLSETLHPIKEISQMTGFTELAAFHRAFCREVGVTPALYRRRSASVV